MQKSKWLWLAVLPVGLICQFIVLLLLKFVSVIIVRSFFSGDLPAEGTVYLAHKSWEIVGGPIGTATFIISGSIIAPKYTFRTAVFLFISYSFLLYYAINLLPDKYEINAPTLFIGGLIGIWIISIANLEIPIFIYEKIVKKCSQNLSELKSLSESSNDNEIQSLMDELEYTFEEMDHELSLCRFKTYDTGGDISIKQRLFMTRRFRELSKKIRFRLSDNRVPTNAAS